jgi:basic amino acid/polyamine antiporter, APA family
VIYLLLNALYLYVIPVHDLAGIDRSVLDVIADRLLGSSAGDIMGIVSIVSLAATISAMTLAGPRVYYAMARDGLFFRSAGALNDAKVPAWGLLLQGLWAVFLVLPRTYDAAARTYGNLYNNLLEYVISAALIFYILTIAGIFRLRATRPSVERPYRAFGYPIVPALYIVGAATILLVLFVYRTATTWPGLIIVLLGVPVYFLWKPKDAVR